MSPQAQSQSHQSLLFFFAGVAATLVATKLLEKKKEKRNRDHGELSSSFLL
jgi:hypothetical protein